MGKAFGIGIGLVIGFVIGFIVISYWNDPGSPAMPPSLNNTSAR
jgi:hypothetical protein